MTISYGVQPTGFVVKPLEVCVSEMQELFRGIFGQGINLDNATPEGQFIGIFAERESELWDMAEEVYSSRDPEQSTGAALSALCAITGTVGPQAATRSQLAALTLGGTTGTIVLAGSQASVAGTDVKFTTLESGTLAAVAAWVTATLYAVGDRCASGGLIYECITAGTSDASSPPVPVSGTDTDITDGSAHWRYLGEGDGAIDVACEAAETGPLAAPSRTLTVIETPISGWDWVTNADDADPGTALETDPALRVRRVVEVSASGGSAVDAMRAVLLKLTGVTACTVFENVTDAIDSFSRPPHSVEALVTGGAVQDILDTIWAVKPGGIRSYGSTSGTVLGADGLLHDISFSRPAPLPIYVIINLQKDDTYPADGDDQVKAAIVAYGVDHLFSGVDVVSFQLKRAITVSGVVDVPTLLIGIAPTPTTETTIGVTAVQQADLDTARIIVNTTIFSGTP